MLTAEEVLKIAKLARIQMREGEVEKYQHELSQVIDYVAELQSVDTEGIEEVSQVTGLENVQRKDEVVGLGNREEILGQAPETKDGYFKVKSIL